MHTYKSFHGNENHFNINHVPQLQHSFKCTIIACFYSQKNHSNITIVYVQVKLI